MRKLTLLIGLAFIFLPPFFAITVQQVIPCEYRVWYLMSNGHIYGYSNNGGNFIKQWQEPAGRTWLFVHGAFNFFDAIDDQGYAWESKPFNQDTKDSIWRVDTDSTGAAFSGNWYIDSYSQAHATIRADSSIWYFGTDVYSLFYAGGSLVLSTGTKMLPTQLSPGGVKFKKIVMGGTVILGLTNDGKIYKWVSGNLTPTIYTPTRPAIDIFASAVDCWGYIMPHATGSQTMGYPFIAGSNTSLYGGSTAFTTPTAIETLWGMTVPIKEIAVDWNTIHYIDSAGKLFGCGWNSFGEVGNGQEFIGHWDYGGFPNYGWSFSNGENPTGIPVQIGVKTNWKHLFKTRWFGFYTYATDQNDSCFSWGRNKANILGNGIAMNVSTFDGSNVDQNHPNTVDILSPTPVTPISARTTTYNFTPPNLSAGSNQSIATSSTTLSASGHSVIIGAVSLPAANGIDTIRYTYNAWTWSKVSGPSCTISTPSTQSTSVTGMGNGTYVFQVLAADDHSGLHKAQVTITVNIPTNQRIHYRFHKTINLKK